MLFLDSLAALGLPGRGYKYIRFDYGMFKQNIVDGRQKSPDIGWSTVTRGSLSALSPAIKCISAAASAGKKTRWIETEEEIIAEAYDQIIPALTDAHHAASVERAQASSEINLGKIQPGRLRRGRG